jgi:RNA polymerase sigma-70 factor (ECF subfamily)
MTKNGFRQIQPDSSTNASKDASLDESTLIAAAQHGDREAFNQLVVHYQSLAYNVAYRVLGDGDAAADATQDAFISAYRAIARFRGGSFKAWVMRIVTNACYDQLRVKQRRPTTSIDADPDMERQEWNVDPGERPEAFVVRQELGQIIQRGLATLPAEQRTCVILSDIQGMSYDEIAQTMNSSLGTVKSRLNRGRRKLRDYLTQHVELLPARYRLYDETAGAGGLAHMFAVWGGYEALLILRRRVDRYE